jgi:hypothetical protein
MPPAVLKPFTAKHFESYCSRIVLDTNQFWEFEPFQGEVAEPILWAVRKAMGDPKNGGCEVWTIIPEGNAKSLDLNTPLPTPDGWTTMGKVQVGDWLLGSDGHGVEVSATSEVFEDRDCYRVMFSDGSFLVASGDHLWTVEGAHDKYRERTLTTQQLFDAGVKMSSGASRWRVKTAARQGAHMDDLPIDPYVLGVWLGDGASAGGRITNVDGEVWDHIELAYDVGHDAATVSGRAETRTVYGLQSELRSLGLLGRKRIPPQYMMASVEQRQELIRGLLDSDGTVSGAGQVSFCNTNNDLIHDVRELAWSLGRPCSEPKGWQPKIGKKAWRITISCDARHALFGLTRKLKKLRKDQMTTEHRRIVSIVPTASVPTKCVQVNAFDRLYLAGPAMIPTHNTTLMAAIGLYCADYSPLPWIPIGAASRDQANILAGQAYQMVNMSPGFLNRFKIFEGYRAVRPIRADHPAKGDRGLQVYAADVGTNDGVIPFPIAICDEGHRWPSMDLYRLWRGKCRKRGASIVMISTSGEPGTEFEELRDSLRDKAKTQKWTGAHLRAVSANGKAIMNEWMVRDPEKISDMREVKKANPLSTISEETLMEDFASPSLDIGTWKRLKCNMPARHSDVAISEAEWFAGRTAMQIPLNAHVGLGVDVAWKHDTFAIVPLWATRRIVRDVDLMFHLLGDAEILTPPRDGSTLHPNDVKVAFETFFDMYQVDEIVIDLERAEDIAAWISDEYGIPVIDWTQGTTNKVMEYEDFMAGLRNGMLPPAKRNGPTLKHTGHSGLTAHVMSGIAKAMTGDKRVFERQITGRKSKSDRRVIDALKAASMINSFYCHPPDENDGFGRDFDPDAFHIEVMA